MGYVIKTIKFIGRMGKIIVVQLFAEKCKKIDGTPVSGPGEYLQAVADPNDYIKRNHPELKKDWKYAQKNAEREFFRMDVISKMKDAESETTDSGSDH